MSYPSGIVPAATGEGPGRPRALDPRGFEPTPARSLTFPFVTGQRRELSVTLTPRPVFDLARRQAVGVRLARVVRRSGRDPGQVPDDAHQGFMDAARKRVLVGLLVGEVARRNQLRLDPKRLNEHLRLIASTYEEPQQVIDLYRNDPQLMSGLQNRVMEEQVIDWIAERAQHTGQQLSFQEAITP